jgi:hypothetical protein
LLARRPEISHSSGEGRSEGREYRDQPLAPVFSLGPIAGLADARFEIVEGGFGAFRSL